MPRSTFHRLVVGPVLVFCSVVPALAASPRPILLEIDRTAFTTGESLTIDAFKAPPDSFRLYGGPGQGDFEDSAGLADLQGWLGVDHTDTGASPPVGDFSKIVSGLTDLDPCHENASPQMTFVDDGSAPNNLPGQSTGGATSTTFGYGLPGGWVVNYSGGLSGGTQSLRNEVWSPEILWNDPATTADDAIEGGASLQYDAWMHLPLANGIFHTWAVRSISTALGAQWSDWRDRGYAYYSEEPRYVRREIEVADLLVDSPERVQIALGVVDLADAFGLPGSDATPSPWIDNVAFLKHTVVGPTLVVHDIDRFHDSFPASGAAFDSMSLSASVTRVDTGRDINPDGLSVLSGDSMVVRVVSTQPGVTLAGAPTMTWYLRANPLFDPVRVVPTTATQIFPGVWKGTMTGLPATDATGASVPHTWFFDFADGPPRNPSLIPEPVEDPFYFPGDRLWAYVGATDSQGDTNYWLATPEDPPEDGGLCGQPGLGKPGPSDPAPTPEEPPQPKPIPSDSLPGIWESPQKAVSAASSFHIPKVLVWDDAVDGTELALFERALAQNGVLAGRDYDVYSTSSPQSGLSNGLGASAGVGATAAQLAPYEVLFYLGGSAPAPLISDGSGLSGNDKGADLVVLEAWLDQASDRAVVSFADHLASAMTTQGSATQTYLEARLGVSLVDDDVADLLGGQVSPQVSPSATALFSTSFVVWGGCDAPGRFDEIQSLAGAAAIAAHSWIDAAGTPAVGAAASVLLDEMQDVGGNLYRRAKLSFPFAFARIRDALDGPAASGAVSARSLLLGEVLNWLGLPTTGLVPVPTPRLPEGRSLEAAAPNPFNPSTTLWLSTDRAGEFTVEVLDLRGRRVTTLRRGALSRGRHALQWRGQDASGAPVASGVYLVQARGPEGWQQVRRVVLVR